MCDPSGACVHETGRDAPETYLHGHSPVIPAVQRALEGRRPGEVVELVASPDAAFGARDEALLRTVPRAEWPAEVPAVPGPFAFALAQEHGPPLPVRGRVLRVDAQSVHIDQNPWLAGVELHLRLELLAVREATEAELAAGVALSFPWDVIRHRAFPDPLGEALARVAEDSMVPPFPWGQVLLAHLLPRLAHLEGAVAELGVGLGGMAMFLAAQLPERTVYALDTFAGLPAPDATHDNPYFPEGLYGGADLLARLRGRLAANGLDNVIPVSGRFADTADALPDALCLAHLDSDLYASVLDSLDATWDRLVDGGLLVIDDFFHSSQGAARALAAFCNRRGLHPTVHVAFPYAVFLVKGSPPAPRSARCHDGFAYSFAWLRTEPHLREQVAASVARTWPGSAAHRDASALLALLDAPRDRPQDIYDYWRSLAAFWQQCAAGFFHAEAIG